MTLDNLKNLSKCLTYDSQIKQTIDNNSTRKKPRKGGNKDNKTDFFDIPVFSVRYKDSSIQLSDDRLMAIGYKGWATVLLTHGTDAGTWYFEIKVLEPISISGFLGHSKFSNIKKKPGIRVGWSCRYNRLDVPIGSTAYGYSFSTNSFCTFNNGIKNYEKKKTKIEPGDIIGCLIKLSGVPYELDDPRSDPHLHPYLELGLLCNPEKPPRIICDPESVIEFSLNGRLLENGYKGIASGFYHPSVSLYMGSKILLNTGPKYSYPPAIEFKPISELKRPEII